MAPVSAVDIMEFIQTCIDVFDGYLLVGFSLMVTFAICRFLLGLFGGFR